MMGDFLRDMQEGITASLGVPAHVIDPSRAVPMPTDSEALLLHILQSPDDDAPRLIYADWLDENKQEWRAEFIRLQIKRAQQPELNNDVQHIAHERDLQGRFGHLWSEGLPQGMPRYFWRGFVEEVRTDHDYFLLHAQRIFAIHPITRVTLHDKRPWESSTGKWIWYAGENWEGITSRFRLADAIFEMLGKASIWDRNRQCRISDCEFNTEQQACLAASQACVALGRRRAGLPALA